MINFKAYIIGALSFLVAILSALFYRGKAKAAETERDTAKTSSNVSAAIAKELSEGEKIENEKVNQEILPNQFTRQP